VRQDARTLRYMAQEPGVRRSGNPKREWNVVTGLPVKQERPDRPVSDKPLTVWNTNWYKFLTADGPAPRWVEVISGAAEDRKPHTAAVPAHTSVTRVKTPMSPTFHLLMTLLTAGGWLLFLVPYMIVHAMSPGRRVKTTYR